MCDYSTGSVSCGDRHLGRDDRVGHVTPTEPSRSPAEGSGRDQRRRRLEPPGERVRPHKAPLPPLHHQRDAANVPRRPAPGAPRVIRGVPCGWVPGAWQHDAPGQPVLHPPGSEVLARAREVQAREVRGHGRGPRRAQDDALWVRSERVPRREPGAQDGGCDSGFADPVLRVGSGQRGARGHDRGDRAHHAEGPAADCSM